MTTALAELPKADVIARLGRLQNQIKTMRDENKDYIARGLGQLSAAFGGAVGAVAKKYLPEIIPGETFDDAGVFGVAVILDVVSLLTVEGEYANEINYFAAGFSAYITGTMVEKILP